MTSNPRRNDEKNLFYRTSFTTCNGDKLSKTALIVDDSSYMREILTKALEEYENLEIVEAKNGEIAFEKFKETEPDIILLDINLPDIKGDELLKKMSETEIESESLIVTGVPQRDLLDKCLECGAKDYIIKPFKLKELKEKIEKLLQNQAN